MSEKLHAANDNEGVLGTIFSVVRDATLVVIFVPAVVMIAMRDVLRKVANDK